MSSAPNTTSFASNITLTGFYSSGLPLDCCFVIEGIIMCFANGLLFTTILAVKSLRKRDEMVIMAGMALADCMFGSAAIYLGLYRIGVWATNHGNVPPNDWECTRLPPIFLINMGLQMTAIMNLVVGIDRLLAVTWPEKYRTWITKIIKKLTVFVVLFLVLSLSAMLLTSYIDDPPTATTPTQMCRSGPFKMWYYRFHYVFIVLVEYLSVIVYVRVFIVYKKILGKVAPSVLYEPHMYLQRRLTATMMITTASTFIFFILPMTAITLDNLKWITLPSRTMAAFFVRISRIVNICVYIFRQREVRREMKKVIMCNFKSSDQ